MPISTIYPTVYSSVRNPAEQTLSACESGCTYTFNNDSTSVTHYNADVVGYGNPSAYYSNYYLMYKPTKYSSETLNVYRLARRIDTSTAGIVQSTEPKTFTNTEYWYIYPCGGPNHGTRITLSTSSQVNHYYSFSGDKTSTTSGSSPRYRRTYSLHTAGNCYYLPTSYKVTNKSVPIYYRPYIWVYKQGFE